MTSSSSSLSIHSGRQRGVASLLVITMLCVAMLLAMAFAQRNLVVAERTSANQYRSAQAFEAAEAALEWAAARLNDPRSIGDDCLPSFAPGATSFRDRLLRIADGSGAITPVTWNDAGTPAPLQAACMNDGSGWSCRCPAVGPAALPVASGPQTAPSFSISFRTGPRAGIVRAVAAGCTRAIGICTGESGVGNEAASRLEASLALVPALRATPVAALTVGGDLDVGMATLGVHNVDAATGGLAIRAAGRVVANNLRVTAPAGSSLAGSVISGDASLGGTSADRLFAQHFGMTPALWRALPGVRRITCPADCTATLAAAVALGDRLVAVEGDAVVTGPIALGSFDAPVALVVGGVLRLGGNIAIDGIVHAASIVWAGGTAPDARVRGAVVASGDWRGNAAPDIAHDALVLARLRTHASAFVRINGSWKDF